MKKLIGLAYLVITIASSIPWFLAKSPTTVLIAAVAIVTSIIIMLEHKKALIIASGIAFIMLCLLTLYWLTKGPVSDPSTLSLDNLTLAGVNLLLPVNLSLAPLIIFLQKKVE